MQSERTVGRFSPDKLPAITGKEVTRRAGLVLGPYAVQRNQPTPRFESLPRDVDQLERLLIIQVMQNCERQNNIEMFASRQTVMADALAQEFGPRVAPSSLFNIARARVKSQVIAFRQIWDNCSRAAANLQNAIARLWLNILANQNPAALRGADQVKEQLVHLRNRKNGAESADHRIDLGYKGAQRPAKRNSAGCATRAGLSQATLRAVMKTCRSDQEAVFGIQISKALFSQCF